MASRITPAMARGIAKKWNGLKGDADYYAQPESVRNRLGKFAQTMGYTTNQPKTTGRSYNRAAYGHMSKLAQMNNPEKEFGMVLQQAIKTDKEAYNPYVRSTSRVESRKAIRRADVMDRQLNMASKKLNKFYKG
jgi:hypothetical protein